MADFTFNNAKGKANYYAGLPGTNDALIAVPLETTGLEADATLKDYDTLSALLAGASNEQTTMGRKTLASVAVTVDDTADTASADAADFTWTAATGNAISKVVICYDPDTTASADANIIPLTAHDFVVTPDGSDVTAQVASGGFYSAS